MNRELRLDTRIGPVGLRPEQAADSEFLYALFRSHSIGALMPAAIDDALRESLIRMQFRGQTASYRAQHPLARYDIIEQNGVAVGRLVTDTTGDVAWIVDIALTADRRGQGLGTALLDGLMLHLGESAKVVRCTVKVDNEMSFRMFRRLGFVAVQDVPPYRLMERRAGAAGTT